ncbi:hypothetical protein RN001_010140 [Aquatica leii]|uniref:Uncharacterized protein n=1 Tax=Aquatica leii TaxID=1421715 RepID=A0AAN7SFX9_9COLE|nr:hypothetical protein RN001_010140 [Aquatica leii]
MAFLHAQSCECIKSELDLFALPSTQTSIESGEWIFYKPLSSLTDDAPIEFVIPGNGNDYLDLSQTMLYVTAKIVRHDDTSDTPGKMDNLTEDNVGFIKRKSFTSENNQIEMIGHVHSDIFNQEKFLVNGVEMKIKFVRSRDSFSLMAKLGSTYKVKILEASLLVRRMKINPTILIAHTKALESTSAKYPITKADVKVLTIPSGIQRKSLDNVFLGQLPKRCIIGFVSNKAFNGDYQIPSKPLQPDFTKSGLYVRAYHTLYSGTGIHFLNEGNDISREDYPKGYCLMAFDLTPDLSANANTHWNLVKNGSLRIEVGFEDALSETINCLVYAEFDNVIEIDKHRNVMVDFSYEKQNTLNFLNKPVVNMEGLSCPTFKELKKEMQAIKCLHHHIESPSCALEHALILCEWSKKNSRDECGTNSTIPCAIIANTDPSYKPGEHWAAFYIDEYGHGEYFDSFGRPPLGYHKKFLERNCCTWTFNCKILQDFHSVFCGQYCLVYLYFKLCNTNMIEFLEIFNNDLIKNDACISLLYNLYFKKINVLDVL